MKIDVIIPVYRPTEKFQKLLQRISMQTYLPGRIILMHTRDGIKLDYSLCKNKIPVTEIRIDEAAFDHGGTRDMGIRVSDADIVVMMTQDAIPTDSFLLENLVKVLERKEEVAVVYARQLPDDNSSVLEKYTRKFNYPGTSRIKSREDLNRMGIKTYFCSNVCAAYRRETYLRLGGFERPVIFNEDMIFAADAIKAGWKVAYNANAKVIHSHHYTYLQLVRRNFDQGVSQICYPDIFGTVKSEKEGIHLICAISKKLIREKKYIQLIRLAAESGCKYVGYQLGKHYKNLPESFIMKLTMNRNYWKERSGKDV